MTYDKDAPIATKRQILEARLWGVSVIVMSGTAAADVDVKQSNATRNFEGVGGRQTPDLTQAVRSTKARRKTRKLF